MIDKFSLVCISIIFVLQIFELSRIRKKLEDFEVSVIKRRKFYEDISKRIEALEMSRYHMQKIIRDKLSEIEAKETKNNEK